MHSDKSAISLSMKIAVPPRPTRNPLRSGLTVRPAGLPGWTLMMICGRGYLKARQYEARYSARFLPELFHRGCEGCPHNRIAAEQSAYELSTPRQPDIKSRKLFETTAGLCS